MKYLVTLIVDVSEEDIKKFVQNLNITTKTGKEREAIKPLKMEVEQLEYPKVDITKL